MAVTFNQIVPWGRSLREYELMFGLEARHYAGGILDCGGGPASFNAEVTVKGGRAVSVDPLYAVPAAEIEARFEAIVEPMLAQVRATPEDWTWGFHRDPEDLRANRRAALDAFLADYERGKREQRYLIGELPFLPFRAASFALAVCSHLLFLYSDLLSEEFHVRSALELCRVAKEVRIFPLLTLQRELSPRVAPLRAAMETAGWKSEIVATPYELQRGGNQMLRLFQSHE